MINGSQVEIKKAAETDSDLLTEISFAAKRHWNYPDHYYELWKHELTITGNYISQNRVYKAQLEELTLGFYSIIEVKSDFYAGETFVKKGFWLEHLFIRPEYHGKGIGRLMMNHAKMIAGEMGICSLLIFVDPFAKGFYDKLGADYLYDSKSSIPGRLIPVYELKI